ncbi:MAG TPA: L-threonylcarbamoyladenylate synthase [Dehalococcoidia bacterium]|nr:L-threonylcarbamoyladenylate synthase [Dehalococcoidia bacterium]
MGSTESDLLQKALEALNAGQLVVIPTDTVYGVAARHDDPTAVAKLFAAKGRSDAKPLPILVSSLEAASEIAELTVACRRLADAFWPGPLTIVVQAKRSFVSDALVGESSIGLRMPDEPLALRLIEGAGGSLAVSSANRSGAADSLSVGQAREQLGSSVAVYVDGGPAPGSRGSTVVDARSDDVKILREGPVSADQIHKALDG